MVVTVTLSKNQAEKLDEYRAQRKQQTGKTMHRDSAIRELMDKALQGIESRVPCGRSMHSKTKEERIEEDSEWANSHMTIGEEQDFGA